MGFLKLFGPSLYDGSKTMTRRLWQDRTQQTHEFAFQNKQLVRVTLGGYGKYIGHALYTDFYHQHLRDVTVSDLRKEAHAPLTKTTFFKTHFPLTPLSTKVLVLEFMFFPSHAQ